MRIAIDANIPYLQDALSLHSAEIAVFEASEADSVRNAVEGAEALLCRSTIKVGENLLQGNAVRFVATATSGTDHFDDVWLRSAGISTASAPGSNARSVAEYVFTALFALAAKTGGSVLDKTLGIVGVGNVGSQVRDIAARLGMKTLLCDPPLKDATGDMQYIPLGDVLAGADILSIHVPLTAEGDYPTSGMIGQQEIAVMKNGAVLINAARGGVVKEPDALAARKSGKLSALVLDVFAGEPRFAPESALGADIATQHIAGHSFDGKLLGTQMVYESLCAWAGWEKLWDYRSHLTDRFPLPVLPPNIEHEESQVAAVVLSMYNFYEDDAAMKEMAALDDKARGKAFSAYRRNYRKRREFSAYYGYREDFPENVGRILVNLGVTLR